MGQAHNPNHLRSRTLCNWTTDASLDKPSDEASLNTAEAVANYRGRTKDYNKSGESTIKAPNKHTGTTSTARDPSKEPTHDAARNFRLERRASSQVSRMSCKTRSDGVQEDAEVQRTQANLCIIPIQRSERRVRPAVGATRGTGK